MKEERDDQIQDMNNAQRVPDRNCFKSSNLSIRKLFKSFMSTRLVYTTKPDDLPLSCYQKYFLALSFGGYNIVFFLTQLMEY